eukprot:m.103286 g.103286  ORF g.103286 m.103286 type:complete len:235 (-) comp15219_c0_seq3:943-1647(-)
MPTIVFSAFLTKQGAVRKSWKRRWMVLDSHDKLSYYKTQQSSSPAGVISLSEVKDVIAAADCGCTWPEHIDKSCAFGLVTPSRNWLLYSDDKKEMEDWMHYIQKGSRIAHPIPKGAAVTSGLTSTVESREHLGRTKSVVVLKKAKPASTSSSDLASPVVQPSTEHPDQESVEQQQATPAQATEATEASSQDQTPTTVSGGALQPGATPNGQAANEPEPAASEEDGYSSSACSEP